ncbi:ABC transporter permease [Pyxidicoccus fallax]|uniref:ABC transporter permease n=2 Tax=Pyxidicoccus fallax TaxID=394095 RepID=A0A848LT76_9BACT|nr:ABC transporter permease [Pyxidicoccus fallax]NMO21188.1 ABC transporter permease [Pyxidicoccus fallax]NPC78685.1 ABC transporter permease [Pyxidicoccus fallax]
MDSLRQDFRYALRTLSRTPGFTLAAGITLALAIGANTVLFSAIHAMLLRPLPFPEPGALVRLWCHQERIETASVSPPELLGWREHGRGFARLSGYARTDLNRTGVDAPERVRAARVTPDFFGTLGVRPSQGRDFTDEDAQPGNAASVVVVSHGFWKRTLGGAADGVGRTVVLNGRSHTVVGVLPEDFTFPDFSEDTEVWVPHWLDAQAHGQHYLSVLGRLAPGMSLEAAREDLGRVAVAIDRAEPGQSTHRVMAVRWQEHLTSNTRPMLWTLWAAVAFVLLIACANVANLMLVRTLARQRDGAIRAALGASRGRRMQQALAESVLLALLGGALGLLLVLWGLELVRTLLPASMLRLTPVELSGPALAFSVALSVGAGLLFGLAPALHTSGMDVLPLLRQSGSAVGARAHHPLRNGLVMVQLALALVLLVGTVLLVRTLRNVQAVDLGFEMDGLLAARLTLPAEKYTDAHAQRAFFSELEGRMAGQPGVEAVGFINDAPLGSSNTNGDFILEGDTAQPGEQRMAEYRVASTDYFRTMRIAVRQGRAFGPQDGERGAPVAIVNEAFVRTYLAGGEALGRRVKLDWNGDSAFHEIVGVVADVRHDQLTLPARPEVYLPMGQVPVGTMTLLLHTRGAASALTDVVRREVRAVDSEQPVYDLGPFADRVDRQLLRPTATARLLAAFALLAVVLAGVGVYGVMAYSVGQRTRELGIRLALGAHPRQVLSLVLGQGLRLTLVGVGVGLVAAFGCTRLLASLLYGVDASEPTVFLGVAAALAAVSLLASWLPALRASRVSPAVSLRSE